MLAGLSSTRRFSLSYPLARKLDSFTVRSAEISIALKGNENLAEQGEAYTDILWDAVVADCHLGETCLDSSDLVIETGMIGKCVPCGCNRLILRWMKEGSYDMAVPQSVGVRNMVP